MSRVQIVAIIVAMALSALDGFDVLSVTFAAPGIIGSWDVGKAEMGFIFSSGLAGMAVGSLLLAPLADVIGRRRMILISLVVMTLGMLLSAVAGSVFELAAWRVFTGAGIGAMVAIINPLAAEFANTRRRTLSVGALTIGYPLGGILGGFAVSVLLRTMEWPVVFWLGAAAGAFMIPVVYWFLPESPSFLMEKRDDQCLERINALMIRCGHERIDALPPPAIKQSAIPYRLIFAQEQRFVTLQLTVANFLFVMTVYFFLSWLPQMVVDIGFDASTGSAMSGIANLGGICGAIAIGVLGTYFRLRPLVIITMIGLGTAVALFGMTPPSIVYLGAMAAVTGFFLNAGITGLFTTIANTFEPRMRATGAGFVIGIGRTSSALAPAIAGGLFAMGASRGEVTAILGACAILAGIIFLIPYKTLLVKPCVSAH